VCLHLRVKDAHGRFHNRDCLVVHHLREHGALAILKHSRKIKLDILWVHFGGEGVGQSLFLASWDHHAISLGRQIPENQRWVR
jgi:hypothetical protein